MVSWFGVCARVRRAMGRGACAVVLIAGCSDGGGDSAMGGPPGRVQTGPTVTTPPSGDNTTTPGTTTVPGGAVTGAGGAAADDGVQAPPPATDPGDTPPPVQTGMDCTDCWAYMGHGTSSTFHNAEETTLSKDNVASLAPLWNHDMGGSATGTPAVHDGVVYAASMGTLVAFEAATGSVIWSAPLNVPGSVTYDEGKLYVQDTAGAVLRIDAASAAVEWTARVGSFGGFGTPLVVGDKVLVGASSGEENLVAENAMFRGSAVALDKASGQVVWQHFTADPPANGAAIWSSPSADPELAMAFFTTGNNYTGVGGSQSDAIIALDLHTGELLWSFQATPDDVYTTVNFGPGPDYDFGTNPILFEAGGQKLVGAGQKSGTFWTLDRMTGQLVWMHVVAPGCGIGGIFNNGAYDGQRIYVSSWPCAGGATLAALDPASGAVLWQTSMPSQSWAPITVAGGVGFIPAQNVMQAFDLDNGNVLFSHTVTGSINSGAVVVDGRVFFGSGVPPLAGSFGSPMDDTMFHALAVP